MPINISTIDIPYVEFSPHSGYPKIHNAFNNTYDMSCVFWHGLFSIPNANNLDWTQPEVIANVSDEFLNDLVHFIIYPYAIHTVGADEDTICNIINTRTSINNA